MIKVALLLANGFEEIEALTPIDVLRRAQIKCDILGYEIEQSSARGVRILSDRIWCGNLSDYDMVILPGGLGGVLNFRKDACLISEIKKMNKSGKWIAAICAAPTILDKAGVLDGKKYTCYDGMETEIVSGCYQSKAVVVDGNIITSRGPATALLFAYELVRCLGGNVDQVSKSMLYSDMLGS